MTLEEERLHKPRTAFARDREPSRFLVYKFAQIYQKVGFYPGKYVNEFAKTLNLPLKRIKCMFLQHSEKYPYTRIHQIHNGLHNL